VPNARLSSRLEVPSPALTDKVSRLLERTFIDPRPYCRAAALAMTWALPPEPQDAEEASQQLSDYFDAVAVAVRRQADVHPVE
jgi:hypothetical protein